MNTVLTNTVVLETDADIELQPVDVDTIAKNIDEDLKAKLGDKYVAGDTTRFRSIVTDIKVESTSNISQTLVSSQLVTLTGGGTIRSLALTTVTDAVMKALIGNQVAVQTIDVIMSDIVSRIRKQVDTTVKDSFAFAWEEGKTFFIVVGITLAVTVVGLVVLMFLRASRRKK